MLAHSIRATSFFLAMTSSWKAISSTTIHGYENTQFRYDNTIDTSCEVYRANANLHPQPYRQSY